MSRENTTIQVSRKLRDTIAELGKKDETFETILSRLVNQGVAERKGGS